MVSALPVTPTEICLTAAWFNDNCNIDCVEIRGYQKLIDSTIKTKRGEFAIKK